MVYPMISQNYWRSDEDPDKPSAWDLIIPTGTRSGWYLEAPCVDHRYKFEHGHWTRNENPMSRFSDFDKHWHETVAWADMPRAIVERFEADLAAGPLNHTDVIIVMKGLGT